ncbi:MAG TPA: hypothetical protein VFQ35_23355 [Polyangiaceae bacterium]|nr:hypothetical protein [Polyangiaceae bacterium]
MKLNEPDWGDFVQNACLRLTVALFAIYMLFVCGSAHAFDLSDGAQATHGDAAPRP